MPPPCRDASDSNPVHIKLADYGMYCDNEVIFLCMRDVVSSVQRCGVVSLGEWFVMFL
jgi:hypothetical protein